MEVGAEEAAELICDETQFSTFKREKARQVD